MVIHTISKFEVSVVLGDVAITSNGTDRRTTQKYGISGTTFGGGGIKYNIIGNVMKTMFLDRKEMRLAIG